MALPPSSVEVWLRGSVDAVPAQLQPVAHALLQAREDLGRVLAPLTTEQLWQRPGGAASIGFHVRHLMGSLDRLLTYARGRPLDARQMAILQAEREGGGASDAADVLLLEVDSAIDRAIAALRETDPATLATERAVGRAQLPTTVLGLLYHAGEHTARHTGQVITTAKILAGTAL